MAESGEKMLICFMGEFGFEKTPHPTLLVIGKFNTCTNYS